MQCVHLSAKVLASRGKLSAHGREFTAYFLAELHTLIGKLSYPSFKTADASFNSLHLVLQQRHTVIERSSLHFGLLLCAVRVARSVPNGWDRRR